jgi:ribosome-binding factor A
MADSRRVERVAALIRREMSELLINGIRDERVQLGMISITVVQVAGDLQHCRIYVSVLGSDDERDQALEGLRSASSYIKGELSRRLKLRRTPEVVFRLDKGLEKGTAVLGMLQRLENERQNRLQVESDADAEVDSTGMDPKLDSHLEAPRPDPSGSYPPGAHGP